MPATGTGARFRKKVSENTNSDCKDAALSGYYSDVYDGQCNVFSNVASQVSPITGAVAFGNSMFPVEYIAEFPMPDPPRFGEAELDGLELNLYFTDINQTNDYTTLNLEVYKLKEPLQTEGNFMALKSETAGGNDIYFASSVADGKTVITENFSNAGDTGNIDLGAFKTSAGSYIFLSLADAYAHQVDGDCGHKMDRLYRRFGSMYLGAKIVRIKLDGDGPDWKTYDDSEHWWQCRPYFTNDHIKNKLQYKGDVMDNSDQDNTYLDITDTILEHLDQTVDYYIGDANGDRNYSAFSRPYLKAASSPTNGVVFSMNHYTSATESTDTIRSYALSQGSGLLAQHGGTYQEIRTYFTIPTPQRLETDWDDDKSDEQDIVEHTGVQVELVVNINLMNSRCKKTRIGTAGHPDYPEVFPPAGSKSTKSDREGDILFKEQKIASMARSFIITLTDRPPDSREKFHHFVWNIQKPPNEGASDHDGISTNPKLKKKGIGEMEAQRFYGIAFWNDGTPTAPNLRAITSGYADQTGFSNEMFFGSINKYWANDGGEDVDVGAYGCPIFERTYDDYDSTDGWTWGHDPEQQLELAGNDHTAGIGLGTWFKVVMAYNSNTDSKLRVYILDMKNNLINYAKFQGWSSGFTEEKSGDVNDFTGDSMPRYCTLWCLSEGIEATAEKDYIKNQDTYTEVLIDSISIRGGEPTVKNATMGLHNVSSKKIHLNSQPTEMLLFNQLQEINPMVFENPDHENVGTTDFPSYSTILSCPTDLIGKIPQAGSLWANSSEAFDSVLPNYLSFGFKHTSALDSSDTHLFLGGYTCDSLNASDGDDATKRPKTINAWLGNEADVGRIMDDKETAKAITIDGTNYVDYFTRKGHFTVNAEAPTWKKRENSFVSTRITDISRASEGRIKVANLSTLLASEDEEYVIYRQTGKYNSWTQRSKARRTGLKVKTFKKEDREIFFENDNGKLHVADNGFSPLCVEEFKDELYISPYRYWLILETWNLGSEGDALPDKTYSHVLSQGSSDGPAAVGRIFGMTFNEHLYSDSPKDSNRWEFSGESGSEFLIYEDTVDYGYGTFEEKETGFLNTPVPIVLENTHTKVDISGLVELEAERLKEVGSLVSLYIRTAANGIAKLHTGKVSATANRPFLNVIYKDALPELSDFKVQPNEEDPFYPTYTWSTGSDDLWYGFLIQDDKAIEHQYHSAVAHIPLNETGTATYLHRYTNETAFGGSRATATDVDKTTSIEGLAGNCLVFDGTTTRHTRFADNTYDQPSGEMSVVAHFVASAADDTHYIVSKYTQFALYVDSSGYIHAKVHYDASNSVNLKSISLVPTDGATPVNAIVTLDVGIPTGNVKLFINGKLEDQSGVKTTDGSVSNWKIDATLPDPEKKLDIGMADTDGSNSMDHPFEGKIEEIVIYNKAIFPVVPQTGELSLFKPITELTTAPIASGKSIVSKLFIKDYHNIRGTTVNQVTSSSMVAYRKSGLGLKTNAG